MNRFERYLGIDYSGARTPDCRLPGLRVFCATVDDEPFEVRAPQLRNGRLWSRRTLADWLGGFLDDRVPTLLGIDHGFSFPRPYFERHGLSMDWETFLEDFDCHWPTAVVGVSVDAVREGRHGNGLSRQGDARWRRLTEKRCRAKSVFHFDVPGSVAKSTHAGLPWLRTLRHCRSGPVHFWPFDGWLPAIGDSVVAEVYPSLWSKNYPADQRTSDQHDAYCVARWMREFDASGCWEDFFLPNLPGPDRRQAEFEGWILGLR